MQYRTNLTSHVPGAYWRETLHARTDIGQVRDHNEDYYGVGAGADVDRFGALFILCDGTSGHAGDAIASRMAVETILTTYYDNLAADRAEARMDAFERANAQIYAQQSGCSPPLLPRCSTTIPSRRQCG